MALILYDPSVSIFEGFDGQWVAVSARHLNHQTVCVMIPDQTFPHSPQVIFFHDLLLLVEISEPDDTCPA